MRKSEKKALRRCVFLCLLVFHALVPLFAQDQDNGGTRGARWVLGLSPFYQVSREALESASSSGVGIARAAALAKAGGQSPLAATLYSLVAAGLVPLPPRRAGDKETAVYTDNPVDIAPPLSAAGSNAAAGAAEGAVAEASVFKDIDGLAVGFFSLEGERIEGRLLLFEKADTEKSLVVSFQTDIARLETMPQAVLPGLWEWAGGRALCVVDIETTPAGSFTILLDAGDSARAVGVDKRLFVFEEGGLDVALRQKGFQDRVFSLSGLTYGSYKKETARMNPVENALEGASPGGASPSAEEFAARSALLDWKQKEDFLRSRNRFYSAFARFVLSIPLSAIALGLSFSYSEAYGRGAASQEAVYASGIGAALSLSLSLGFGIDTTIKLIDVLHASR